MKTLGDIVADFVRWKSDRMSILFWKILMKSRIFLYWRKRFLNDLMFDLQIYDFSKEEVMAKYQKMLDRANSA